MSDITGDISYDNATNNVVLVTGAGRSGTTAAIFMSATAAPGC